MELTYDTCRTSLNHSDLFHTCPLFQIKGLYVHGHSHTQRTQVEVKSMDQAFFLLYNALLAMVLCDRERAKIR